MDKDQLTEHPQDDPLVVNCADCGRPTRKFRITLAERPDTASWGGNGRCTRCYKPETRRGQLTPDQIAAQRQAHATSGLGSFMERRNARLKRKKPHGIPAQQVTPASFTTYDGGSDDAA